MRSNENFLKSLRGRTKRRERENKTVGGMCKINFQPQWKLEKDKVDFEVLSRTMLKAKLLGG